MFSTMEGVQKEIENDLIYKVGVKHLLMAVGSIIISSCDPGR